jgi:hypothetical protein
VPLIRISGGGGATQEFIVDVLVDAAEDFQASAEKGIVAAVNAVSSAVAKKTISVAITVAARLPKLRFLPGLLPGVVLSEVIAPESLGEPEFNIEDYKPGGRYYRPDLPVRVIMRPAWLADP